LIANASSLRPARLREHAKVRADIVQSSRYAPHDGVRLTQRQPSTSTSAALHARHGTDTTRPV